MERKWVQLATLGLGTVALVCWVVMFLAGTDIWHALGRPDFWRLQGPTDADLRAFAYAFCVLPVVLAIHLIVTAVDLMTARVASGAPGR